MATVVTFQLVISERQVVNLIIFVVQEQVSEEKENGEETDPSTSALTYCVERLIRGLASTRESSLQGFFICLVELLRQHAKASDEASVDHVCQTIGKILHVKGSKSVS